MRKELLIGFALAFVSLAAQAQYGGTADATSTTATPTTTLVNVGAGTPPPAKPADGVAARTTAAAEAPSKLRPGPLYVYNEDLYLNGGNISVRPSSANANGMISPVIGFGPHDYSAYPKINAYLAAQYGDPWYTSADLLFYTTSGPDITSPSAAASEKMRITGSGRVGIGLPIVGLTEPPTKFQVVGSSLLNGIWAGYNDPWSLGNTDNGQQIHFGGSTSNLDLILAGYAPYGRVGIGTLAPTALLTVGTSGGSGTKVVVNGDASVIGTIQSTSGALQNLSVAAPAPAVLLTSTNSTQRSAVSTNGSGLTIDVVGHAIPANNFIAFRTTNVANSFTPVEAMRITSTGQVGIGTAPSANFRLDVNGDTNITGTLTASSVVNAVYGQDVAEWVRGDRDLAAGTVVILNPEKTNEVIPSTSAYDTTVAGVVSAQPGIILGRAGALKATVATSGRVRVRVDARKGAIRVGDLLVTSDEPGTAMKSQPVEVGGRKFHQPGTILGKALEPLPDGVGEILVLLCLG